MSGSKGSKSPIGGLFIIAMIVIVLFFGRPLIAKLIGSFLVVIIALLVAAIVFVAMIARHYVGVEKAMQNKQLTEGVTQKDLNEILYEAKGKIRKLDQAIGDIEDLVMKKDIVTIIETANKILEAIKNDPTRVKTSKKFLNYYLDTTVNIIEDYQVLNSSQSVKDKNEEVIEKVAVTLKDIIKCFEYEYTKLFDDTAMNLDVEIAVLKTTIEQKVTKSI